MRKVNFITAGLSLLSLAATIFMAAQMLRMFAVVAEYRRITDELLQIIREHYK